jgi:hypothetical protein
MVLYLDGKLVATKVSGGGTGVTSFTDHGVVLGSGSDALSVTSAGTAGYVLTSGGSGADPDWAAPNAGDITSIVAGTGLTGTSLTGGDATLNVIGGTGITATDDDISVDASLLHVTHVGALEAGSISANFGTINNGDSTITTTGLVTAGSIATGGSILIDSTPDNTVYSGITASFMAGEALDVGEVVYLNAADSRVWKAVSVVSGTGLISAEVMCMGMVAVAQASAGSQVIVLLQGFLQHQNNFPTYAVGETLYVPEAEVGGFNVPEGVSPDTDGDFIQVTLTSQS